MFGGLLTQVGNSNKGKDQGPVIGATDSRVRGQT